MIDKKVIAELLSELLPKKAEVEYDFDRPDFFASFCWLLHTDPKRPFKRSKKVNFMVYRKALKDFAEVGNKNEAKLLIDLEAFINHQLDMFDPEHDRPEGAPEPIVTWVIDSLLFLESLESIKGIKRRMF